VGPGCVTTAFGFGGLGEPALPDAGAPAAGGSAADQHAQAIAAGVRKGTDKQLAHGAESALIMMLRVQAAGAGFGWGRDKPLDLDWVKTSALPCRSVEVCRRLGSCPEAETLAG